MKAVRAVLDYLVKGNVDRIFGIPAGSVNALFDELTELTSIEPVIAKHEGAAAYMAAAYAKSTNKLSVCVGCSGPGSTNLVTGAANAMREYLPMLFLTGHVPLPTQGLNASQELDAEPIFRSVTKYSVTVKQPEELLSEVAKAVNIAVSGVPGPVHVAMPIDIQLTEIAAPTLPEFPVRSVLSPDMDVIRQVAAECTERVTGCIFVGQGAREATTEIVELAELLNWPIVTTPMAKGFLPDTHPLMYGVYGFAGHEAASQLVNEGDHQVLLVIGSSLGETATSNYSKKLVGSRFMIHVDHDESVFNRLYKSDIAVLGDTYYVLRALIDRLKSGGSLNGTASLAANAFDGAAREDVDSSKDAQVSAVRAELSSLTEVAVTKEITELPNNAEYNTQNVLLALQALLQRSTKYTVDIGEHMSYVIHHMRVMDKDTFDINVHLGPMGIGIASAIGHSLADRDRQVVSITGDGCFFMHGMEILTAKEYGLPILFIVLNNSRLGMVYHGHNMQYKRSHSCFEQIPVSIAEIAKSMGIRSARIQSMADIKAELITELLRTDGPAVLEVELVDEQLPPMGDRVKFLSSFGA